MERAKQRLRWVPRGTFWMGSPNSEEGRWEDEGPRHEETIPSGFWVFDTPCTQALWEAAIGENPSHFKGPDRPVENVSWDQCQEFLKRLNDRCKGLELKLPTETQWEYACRAGTDTPRYREDLDVIAWYGDNSNDETHPVGQKVPNDWGLFDTLGNVDEWCQDSWTDDYNQKGKVRASRGASTHRVVRGGSWLSVARVVRAAGRDRSGPSFRNSSLGFRCAEFRAPGPVGKEKEAERARERGGVGAEHPGDRDQASGAGWINLDAPGKNAVSFADLRRCASVPTSSRSCSARSRCQIGLPQSAGTSLDCGRSSRSREKPRSRARNARPVKRRRSAAGNARPRPPAPPLDPAGSVPDGFASQRVMARNG